jgi:hypothetical protein
MASEIERSELRRGLREASAISELSARQQRGIVALLTHPTLEEAAQEAGVHTQTVRRWLRDPDFERVLRAERSRALEFAVGKLHAASTAAVDALTRALNCGTPSVEVQAARIILDTAFKSEESYILSDKIAQLLRSIPMEEA